MHDNGKVCIIIPAFNEEDNIKGVTEKIKQLIADDMELIVVDDGSTDGTIEVLRQTNTNFISLAFNAGYGAAVQTGIKYALRNNFEYVVLMDADGQHNPEDIFTLLDIVKKCEADLVIGSRFLKDMGYKQTLFRRLGGMFFSFWLYCLSGVRTKDPTSGFQAFNRKPQKIYAGALFPADYPDADMLLLLSYHSLKIKEVPVKMNVKAGKSMHSGIRTALYYIYKMLFSILIVVSYRSQIKRRTMNGY